MVDDGVREATDLDTFPVMLAITDSVATGNSQQQNSSHYVALRQK
jgi:hypothetical protein